MDINDLKSMVAEELSKQLKEEEDVEVGHKDDEPEMIQDTVYEIGKYAIELYKMLEEFERTGKEIDFPHWWQAKIVKSREFISSATHFLENETRNSEL